ncbi:MAG: response regulator, partial [Pseudomonadota bacterium]
MSSNEGQRKKRLLIVDDEPDLRELLSMTANAMGLEATLAPDLSGARDALGNDRFDLCLTDMRLPDGDGLELVSLIQGHFPGLPVAVI